MSLINRTALIEAPATEHRIIGPVEWFTLGATQKCLRLGCSGTGPLRAGLCNTCHCRLRIPTISKRREAHYGETSPPPKNLRRETGDRVLVSLNCPDVRWRGAFGRVTRLCGDGTAVVVYFSGARLPLVPVYPGHRLRDSYATFLVHWLLLVADLC